MKLFRELKDAQWFVPNVKSVRFLTILRHDSQSLCAYDSTGTVIKIVEISEPHNQEF